jgi:F0F1-type ATP synthase assembly protein I
VWEGCYTAAAFGQGARATGRRAVDRNTLRVLAIASQLGVSLAVPLVFFVVGGIFLDKKVGTSPLFLLIGIVCGFIGAGYALYDTVKRIPTGRRPPPNRPDRPE